ncbi:sensor histidine kinase [Paenibacillus gansuensis]|uniref:histidine kinase n=1 Tax=Paenibacillus gansuensis TaxID=306542 RepID=A0ABW5PHV6_9BACL
MRGQNALSRTAAAAKKIVSPRSLRAQLLSRTLLILALILLLIGILQYVVMKDFLYRNQAETLEAKLLSIPGDVLMHREVLPLPGVEAPGTDENGQVGPDRLRFLFLQDFSLAVVERDGTFKDVAGNNGLAAPVLTGEEYRNVFADVFHFKPIPYRVVKNENGVEQIVMFRPLLTGLPGLPALPEPLNPDRLSTVLQMGIDTGPLRAVLLQQLLTFVMLAAAALAAGLAVYLPVLRRTLVPLSRIGEAVGQTNAGNLAERFPAAQGQEEIDRLALAFNAMLERLAASFEHEREAKEQMRRFIADASHELRTPLTSIHGFLEVLLRGAADRPEQLYKALNSMHGESRRIIKLVEDLLLLAKLDRAPELQLREVPIAELVREMEPQLAMLAGERGVSYDLTEGMSGMYDADKLKQVILNLFHNAVQHTDPATGRIRVSLTASGKEAELSVRDNGPGIDEAYLPHVFDRFYRVDTSRTRKYGGAGLGLSITKSIVEAHGGTVAVDSRPGAGAAFTIRLR